MPRSDASQARAISFGEVFPAAIALNKLSSMAALIAAVRWCALIVSNKSAGVGWLLGCGSGVITRLLPSSDEMIVI